MIAVLDIVFGQAGIGRDNGIERVPPATADVIADFGTFLSDAGQRLGMCVNQELVPNEAELVANVGNGGPEVLFADFFSAGEMAFNEPAKDSTGSAP